MAQIPKKRPFFGHFLPVSAPWGPPLGGTPPLAPGYRHQKFSPPGPPREGGGPPLGWLTGPFLIENSLVRKWQPKVPPLVRPFWAPPGGGPPPSGPPPGGGPPPQMAPQGPPDPSPRGVYPPPPKAPGPPFLALFGPFWQDLQAFDSKFFTRVPKFNRRFPGEHGRFGLYIPPRGGVIPRLVPQTDYKNNTKSILNVNRVQTIYRTEVVQILGRNSAKTPIKCRFLAFFLPYTPSWGKTPQNGLKWAFFGPFWPPGAPPGGDPPPDQAWRR